MATFLSPDSGYSLLQPQPATSKRLVLDGKGCRFYPFPIKKQLGCKRPEEKAGEICDFSSGATAEDVLEALGPSPLKKKAAHGTHWVRRT